MTKIVNVFFARPANVSDSSPPELPVRMAFLWKRTNGLEFLISRDSNVFILPANSKHLRNGLIFQKNPISGILKSEKFSESLLANDIARGQQQKKFIP